MQQFRLFKQDFYLDILEKIADRRSESINYYEANTEFEAKLIDYRKQFRDLLSNISQDK